MSETPDKAKDRARIIMMVQSGQITAREGAKRLGVSTKTYYKWEKRALNGLVTALGDGSPGRPEVEQPDPRIETLEKEVEQLRKEITTAEQKADIRRALEVFREWQDKKDKGSKKNSNS